MSFGRYPAHKDSGVEWLGDVPEHWEVRNIQDLAKSRRYSFVDGPFGSDLKNEEYTESGVPLIQLNNITDGDHVFNDIKYVSETKADDLSKHNAFPGDIVIAKMADPVARAAVVKDNFPRYVIVADCIRLAVNTSCAVPGFAVYAINSKYFRSLAEVQASGITRLRINLGALKHIRIAVPSVAEQIRIAAFLDRETAKIDRLVAEQQRLIDLLKEKRQAVISHAVTKGLNPAAPMKPSGIAWLGEVPAHWKVGKCGFYISILSGFAFPSAGFTEDEGATKLLRGINVGVTRLKWDETVYWHREPGDGLDVYEMHTGDVVMGMDRPLISEGIRAAKVKECDLPCLLLQRVTSLKVGRHLHSDYLLSLLSSDMFIAHFSPDTTGVSVPHISPEQINNFVIPVPPMNEQEFIVSFINNETAKLDALTAEAQRAIDILQERRTALISAAVTGQIDVRHLAEATAA